MKKLKKFQFPKALLNQIDSCTKGFVLVVVNEDNQFETFQSLADPLTQVGMVNFLEIFSTTTQAIIREQARDQFSTETGDDEEDEGDFEED